ncbi:MAG: replication initiator protein A [Bacillota bacterium]|nr:replication initiator protein A [Bacillota bacterium]
MTQKFLRFTAESLSASYIPFPRFLMEDTLSALSNDAKVLYALMLDRASISKVNGFIEKDGTIRLYFTVEQAQEKLHRSRQCVTRIFRELESIGLICRRKQGLCRPAVITLNYPSTAKLITPRETSEKLSE